jgi:hypothetical protein
VTWDKLDSLVSVLGKMAPAGLAPGAESVRRAVGRVGPDGVLFHTTDKIYQFQVVAFLS